MHIMVTYYILSIYISNVLVAIYNLLRINAADTKQVSTFSDEALVKRVLTTLK